jgi:patatin-like phospholipase/acyl hydrolase
VSDAVQASCSAYPFFERKIVKTDKGDVVELIDGGYCANNPTLYAIADATMGLKVPAGENQGRQCRRRRLSEPQTIVV